MTLNDGRKASEVSRELSRSSPIAASLCNTNEVNVLIS